MSIFGALLVSGLMDVLLVILVHNILKASMDDEAEVIVMMYEGGKLVDIYPKEV